jgi:hypothetical protein
MAVASKKRRAAVATAMLDLDKYWTDAFGDLGLGDINYSDLFFQMWLQRETPLGKTGLYDFMPGISRRTAVKYVQDLIDRGLLEENSASHDRRIKHVAMTAELATRLERYLDFACERLSKLD